MRRPKEEYFLENEAEKMFLNLPNGVKLRVLHLPALETDPNDEDIIYYTGYLSYIYIWKDSVLRLREQHDIYFIETREKEFSEMPEDDLSFDVFSLAEDFYYALNELNVDIRNSVFIGSSIASNAILLAMSRYGLQPKIAALATPQIILKPSKEAILLGKIPFPIAYLLKPLVYGVLFLRYLKDQAARKNMFHGVSRMITHKHWKWMKEAPPPSIYVMEKDEMRNVSAKVLIIAPEYDPAHDTEAVKQVADYLPNAEIIKVGCNSETHNAVLANVVIRKLREV